MKNNQLPYIFVVINIFINKLAFIADSIETIKISHQNNTEKLRFVEKLADVLWKSVNELTCFSS